jgi:hypothetical protein
VPIPSIKTIATAIKSATAKTFTNISETIV